MGPADTGPETGPVSAGVIRGTEVIGDYQQYELDRDGIVAGMGDRMRAKLKAIQATGLPADFVAGKSVLDVGCDHGFWSLLASTAGARSVLGLDRNREVKGRGHVDLVAENNARARAFPRHARVHFCPLNLGAQWHEFGRFDVVLAMSVLHHAYAQCGDHQSVWFWLARHTAPGGTLVWEGPIDATDPVIRKDVPEALRPGYSRKALREAAGRWFDVVSVGPALHEATREVWILRRTGAPTGSVIERFQMQDGAKGAGKAFARDYGRRMYEIEIGLGVRPYPGSLNLLLPACFDWERNYYRVELFDSTDRRNADAEWAPRWCRFYPLAIREVGAWAMRFEGETYPDNFVELIAQHRLRDLISESPYIEAGGFLWPATGSVPAQIILHEVGVLDEVLGHVPGRKVAVQAGGNVGVYPARLAKAFEEVHTFEPDADNFACLMRNVRQPNVRKYKAALGDAAKTVGLLHTPHNTGAHHIAPRNPEGSDLVDVVTIDVLGLKACDLICLDVEGVELSVLKGAIETIAAYRPVILFEDKGVSERYGVAKGEAERWLADTFGYRVIGRTGHDTLMGSP